MVKNTNLIAKFKDATVVVVVMYRRCEIIERSMRCLFESITNRPNTYAVLINNSFQSDVFDYFESIDHPQCVKFQLPFNFGKALAANFFFSDFITEENLPKTIVSMDPDIVFSKDSLDKLVEASEQLPQCGMIGMRYTENNCNPERNLFFKPKRLVGQNQQDYFLSCPFMCTVAGPILAIQGRKIFLDCANQLFPKKFIKVYGGDDSALYNALRWKYVNGYLEGTQVTHMVSGAKVCMVEDV